MSAAAEATVEKDARDLGVRDLLGFVQRGVDSKRARLIEASRRAGGPVACIGDTDRTLVMFGSPGTEGGTGRMQYTFSGRQVEIGKPRRTYEVEPLEDPVPRELPEELPDPERPAGAPGEPEQVPSLAR